MSRKHLASAFSVALTLAGAASLAPAQAAGKSMVTPVAELKWASAGIPGVSAAVVDGDMAKGPSHFYLRYDAGLVTPLHHHSPDHYATVVSGTLLLTAAGKENRLGPGSFFALTGMAKHIARVEGKEPCVMFIDARGAWDVVAEPAAGGKK